MNLNEWDFQNEGEVLRLWQANTPVANRITPDDRPANVVKAQFPKRMVSSIKKGFAAGLPAEAMRECIRINFSTYNIDPETAPIDEWMVEGGNE